MAAVAPDIAGMPSVSAPVTPSADLIVVLRLIPGVMAGTVKVR